jgi:hypothetical protein
MNAISKKTLATFGKLSKNGVLLLLSAAALRCFGEPAPSADTARAVEAAHATLWQSFVGPDGVIRDYVGDLPTPEDCALGRPNAIGWWSPIENGPMFTGLYLPAMCERAKRSGRSADKEQARRLAQGLMLCASVSDVPGFIARGMGTDGRCHYPLGSDDQTHPWFYGLHAYAMSDLPDGAERERIVAKMREVADVLESTGWRCPCDGAFKGDFRGGYKGHLFRDAVRYLHLLRVMADVTGEEVWLRRYRTALAERPEKSDKTRAEICALGYPLDREAIANIDATQLWIYVGSQGALAKLAALETDEAVLKLYRAGLAVNAASARPSIGAYRQFDNADAKVFGHADWRACYPEWFPQKTQADALRLSKTGDKKKMGERKGYEVRFMRNPLAAAAVVALAGDAGGRDEIERAITHYDYAKLNMAELFFAECAWYALPEATGVSLRIMPVGDSITRGTYMGSDKLANPLGGGWRKPLQDKLRGAGIPFEFVGELDYWAYGTNGIVAPTFSPQHHGLAGFSNQAILKGGVVPTPKEVLAAKGVQEIRVPGIVEAVARNTPDIILLMSGANGFNAKERDGLIETICSAFSGELFVASITPQKAPRHGWEHVASYNASLPSLVETLQKKGHRIYYVDMCAALMAGDISQDGVHPNTVGLDKIAETWFRALAERGSR